MELVGITSGILIVISAIIGTIITHVIDKNNKIKLHDRNIFEKLCEILDDRQFQKIKDKTMNCDFPDLFCQVDELWKFVEETANEFINKKLQKKY